MSTINQTKDITILEKRFTELSKIAYQRDIITFSDFLNLNEQNILHTLPKDSLYTHVVLFGGYEMSERQIAAFIPDALYLCYKDENNKPNKEMINYPFSALEITPVHEKFSEELTHRDYLGAILNLGIDRCKIGDIITNGKSAIMFVHRSMVDYVLSEFFRVRHTSITLNELPECNVQYTPSFEIKKGSVASVRLDTLLALAFSSSRSKLTGLIEGGKVFVNGKLITSNGYQPQISDLISVRGLGKFQYYSIGNKTKKNRIYVELHKFI